jgi:hypothetical protein
MAESLLSYDEVPAEAKVNLLLGNGFSLGLHGGFQYGSLKQQAEAAALIGDEERGLFAALGTVDFEKVLSRLVEAQVVNDAHHLEDKGVLRESYLLIRDALIKVVSRTHPLRKDIPSARLVRYRQELRRFRRIFTTNYDLLLYWIAAQEDAGGESLRGFLDFFWNAGNTFDAKKVDVLAMGKPTCLYYLHGALFLSRKGDRTRKVIRQGADLLTTLRSSPIDAAPVFVSEGDAVAKRRSIAQNDYLDWVYTELENLEQGVTVFGHSLSAPDSHILAALCRDYRGPLAVGIYEQTAAKILPEVARLRGCFAEHGKVDDLLFFDARTFPLAGS